MHAPSNAEPDVLQALRGVQELPQVLASTRQQAVAHSPMHIPAFASTPPPTIEQIAWCAPIVVESVVESVLKLNGMLNGMLHKLSNACS